MFYNVLLQILRSVAINVSSNFLNYLIGRIEAKWEKSTNSQQKKKP